MRIPQIACSTQDGDFCATFGLELTSVQHGSAMCDPYHEHQYGEVWKIAHQRNVRLLHAFSRWPHPCSIELHVVSHPSLDEQVVGRNEISLRFHVKADTADSALELALADSVRLDTLLNAFWPAAKFAATSQERLTTRYEHFTPQSCLLVGRRDQLISPANPISPHKSPIGFQTPRGSLSAGVGPSSKPTLRHLYPWVPSSGEDMATLLEALVHLPTPRWIVVRVGTEVAQLRNQALRRLDAAVAACERFLSGAEQGQLTLTAQAQTIRDASLNRYAQLSDAALCGAVLVFAPGCADSVIATLLGQSITGDHGRRQTENLLEGGYSVRDVPPSEAIDCFRFFEDEPVTAEEAACAFRLPLITDHRDLGIRVQRHRTAEFQLTSTSETSTDQIKLGINVHKGVSRPITVSVLDRLHHCLFIGATGAGKSTMLLSMILQDARSGQGLALIDPPGELADEFLARFPRERVDDLVIVDFDDREAPVPLNLLFWQTVEERDLLIDTLYSTLLAIYRNPDFFGPIFESHFRSGLRLLLGDQTRSGFTPTLLELPQVFRNPEFRKYLQTLSTDEEVKGAIQEADRITYGEQKLENIAPYVNAKFARFLQDTQLRRIVGNGRMALDFRTIMDQGKIIVFKLAQGRLGRHVSDMLLAQLVARFRLAAMSRADVPSTRRRPFFLYCDEFQVIADENFAEMLSQCRKYALGLVLANQYATQLRERGVLEAVLANVGTIASYRLGAEDAKLLAPVFAPTVGASDLVECPNWQGYMRLHSHRAPVRAFSFQNAPDATPANAAWARQLCDLSRKRWGVPARETEQRIRERNQFIRGLPDSACAPVPIEPNRSWRPEGGTSEDTSARASATTIDEPEQWKLPGQNYGFQTSQALIPEVHEALMSLFLFFQPTRINWFLALAEGFVNRGELSAEAFAAFLNVVLADPSIDAGVRGRINTAQRARQPAPVKIR
jgi:hypothetical protein